MLHEAEAFERKCFVTWTYDDEHLPSDCSVDRSVLQKALKRLRKALPGVKIRYYMCGEYGEQNGRPHYHAVLLGVEPDWKTEVTRWGKGYRVIKGPLTETWPFGHVHAGTVTGDSIRYVTDYIGKAVLGKGADSAYGARRKPFALMSKGVGLAWCNTHAAELRESLGCTFKGAPIALPRYYCKKLDITSKDPRVVEKRQTKLGEVAAYHYEHRLLGERSNLESLRRSRAQASVTADARAALRRRKV